jgi:hypothetical protein
VSLPGDALAICPSVDDVQVSGMASLDERVSAAAATVLKFHKRIDPLEVIVPLGCHHGFHEQRWRAREVDCLDTSLFLSSIKLPAALASSQRWCEREGLVPVEASPLDNTREHRPSRISRGGRAGAVGERIVDREWSTLAGELPCRAGGSSARRHHVVHSFITWR